MRTTSGALAARLAPRFFFVQPSGNRRCIVANMSYSVYLIDFEIKPAQDLLVWAIATFPGRFGIVTSFQAEGMVLVDMAWRLDPGVRVITLDTGRLPAETYQIIETVRKRYQIEVEMVHPNATELASMTTRFGPNLFREQPALRKLCCQIRKVRPLAEKLTELSAYAVGLRRQQSETRGHIPKAQELDGRTKLSPLADWTAASVGQYLAEHDVPLHPLYAQGYKSIGCGPCTRAVLQGEDERAGRWWWELDAVKECGLHFTPEGKMQRQMDVFLDEVLAR